jgi:hypothetical protein
MENRVGDNVPPPAQLDPLLLQAQKLKSTLDTFCITLTPEERQSRVKPLRGAEPKIRLAADLCQRYGITLKAVPIEGMLADLDLVQTMAPFVAATKSAAQMAEDTQNQAFSEAWQAFLALYGALQVAAEHDAALAEELKELVDFMKIYATRKKPAEKAEKEEPTPPPGG